MEAAARQLYDCTKRLYTHLKKGLPKKNREDYIAAIQQLLEERQQGIDRLPNSFKGGALSFAEEMLVYDQAIQKMLAEMFEEIRENVHRIRRQKVTTEKYTHPYRSGSIDGIFLDKRK